MLEKVKSKGFVVEILIATESKCKITSAVTSEISIANANSNLTQAVYETLVQFISWFHEHHEY